MAQWVKTLGTVASAGVPGHARGPQIKIKVLKSAVRI